MLCFPIPRHRILAIRAHVGLFPEGIRSDNPSSKVRFSYESAFLNAVENGEVDLVRECLKNGVPISLTNAVGVTALHTAALSAQLETAQFLLDNGADIQGAFCRGRPALTMCWRAVSG